MENPDGSVSFGALNTVVLILYLVSVVGVGLFFAGRQKTAEDFFLAGRNMPWLAVAVSVFASITSAVSYMGVPGLAFRENISFLAGICMMPLAAPVIIRVFLPFYQRLRVTTSYDYIHQRFGAGARVLAAGLFFLTRLGWLGTVIYAPALALSVVTGMDIRHAILIMGGLGTLYTVLGGLAAVIWTDVIQFVILSGGALWVCLQLIADVPGGIAEILRVGQESGRINLANWRPSWVEMTLGGVVVGYFLQFLHDYGVDQVTVQRLMATRTPRDMAKATFLNSLVTVVFFVLLALIGLGLFAYSQSHPRAFPPNLEGDKIFAWYAVHALPPGVSGLIIAGIFAAAMSSLDSGINSLATVVVNDFLRPFRARTMTDTAQVRLARVLTLVFGVFATGAGFIASRIGALIAASQTFIGLFSGPVLALFLLGIFSQRAVFAGWLCGVAAAIPATLYLKSSGAVHFIYYFPISFSVAFSVGYLASRAFPAREVGKGLTIKG